MASRKRQTTEILRELLNLIPVLAANPGMTLEELGRITGITQRARLREVIFRLMMFGRPPFSPSDYVEVSIDEQDRVYVHFPQGMDRPVGLTPGEWNAVRQVIVKELEFQRGGEAGTAQLRSILDGMSTVPVAYDPASPFQTKRTIVEEALQDAIQLQFNYQTLSSREPEIRTVDPWALFQHRKVYYLIGFCHLRRDARFFHLERMENLELLDLTRSKEPPEDLGELMKSSPIFSEEPSGFAARIAFRPDLRPAMELYFGVVGAGEAPTQDDGRIPEGWLSAECRVRESIWFRSMLRSLGPGVMILEPAHLRESYREELDRLPVPEPI